jgi:nucleoside-diphosphate-sugar epimerase
MERVLVTGAGGYIGTTLVPMLVERGIAVRAVDRFFFGEDLLPRCPELELVKADVRLLEPEHLEGVDAVIDLVAISNDPSGETFRDATNQINHRARVRCAELAKAAGVERYLLPSSCSVYGFQDPAVRCAETSPTHPLTTYAKANERAERGVLALADDEFCVVVLRQSTLYGCSPRMRFDLAVNGMTYGAWKDGVLPLMRDGSQWRPMLHVRDAASAQIFMLGAPREQINGQIFNVGSEENNYQLGPLAELVAQIVPGAPEIRWYGDPDHRSYRVDFEKIERLGWKAELTARDGATEICARLEDGTLQWSPSTVTLSWYQELERWHRIIKDVELLGGILDIDPVRAPLVRRT